MEDNIRIYIVRYLRTMFKKFKIDVKSEILTQLAEKENKYIKKKIMLLVKNLKKKNIEVLIKGIIEKKTDNHMYRHDKNLNEVKNDIKIILNHVNHLENEIELLKKK